MQKYLFLICSCLLISCESEDCDKNQICLNQYTLVLKVKDQDYFNIQDFPFLNPKGKEGAFKQYITHVGHLLKNTKTGHIFVFEPKRVEGISKEYIISFNSVPDGQYQLVVWGNIPSLTTSATASQALSQNHDIYAATSILDFKQGLFGNETLYMERLKGLLFISGENFPSEIDKLEFSISNIYETSINATNYSGSTTFKKELQLISAGQFQFTNQLAPSLKEETSSIDVKLYSQGKEAGTLAIPPISILRNTITAINMIYNPKNQQIEAFIWLDNNWRKIHNMSIE